ncbi:sensor histidine kinase [Microvirga subterranea]|uniref:Blue-light-activated histidine kinase n=1 Tax=Microvirga subterranea TaxID=186651 RepID=A0A370HK27_9HYPH|nr:HWE histidine kinase domain-containing protein [Microvirga subterranea]RDI58690.1 PAS domain S-box-containing protein [Microvirga subterranea]
MDVARTAPTDLTLPDRFLGDLTAPTSLAASATPPQMPHPSAVGNADSRLAVVLEGIGDAFYALDRDWRFTYINRAAETFYGIPREEMLGRVIWDLFPWSEGTELRARYEQVFLTGEAASFEAKAVSSPDRYVEFHVFPYDGGIAVSFRDWTERRRAEEELRETQARLSALADNLPVGMVYQMLESDNFFARKFIYLSASCERLNGIPAEAALANPFLLYELLLPEHRQRMFEKQVESFHQKKPFDIEVALRHAQTGEIRWQRLVATPRELPSGGLVWDGIQIDITDHKRAEEHLKLLVNELNHRVKNTLAIVQSLSAQSFSRVDASVDAASRAREAFEARLFALARGHDVLTRENWEGASLATILDEAFAAYRKRSGEADAFEVRGPDLRVTPSMALSLSMALHELCTNALKYGALKEPGGRVLVSWEMVATADGNRLVMRWQETGGPPVTPPTRKGFGSRLIEGGLARELNGQVAIAYETAGVVCTIDVPV